MYQNNCINNAVLLELNAVLDKLESQSFPFDDFHEIFAFFFLCLDFIISYTTVGGCFKTSLYAAHINPVVLVSSGEVRKLGGQG